MSRRPDARHRRKRERRESPSEVDRKPNGATVRSGVLEETVRHLAIVYASIQPVLAASDLPGPVAPRARPASRAFRLRPQSSLILTHPLGIQPL
jgi:hypothetical protein